MLRSAVALALAISLAITFAAPPRLVDAAPLSLSAEVEALLGSFHGGASVWVADPALPSAPLVALDADRSIITASLYKLALLAEAERLVDLGKLRYSDVIVIGPEDITDDGSFWPIGAELTLDQALEQMITISDNGTAMHFWRMLGPDSVNATLAKAGMRDFHVAVGTSEDNVATARSLGTFFTLLARRKLISAAASDRMTARLRRQQINDRLPAQLPSDVAVAHKTGNLVGLVHDGGLIYTPSGPRTVVVLTWDADDASANVFISGIGSTVYASVLAPPASVRYAVPTEPEYAQITTTKTFSVGVQNTGDRAWAATGADRLALSWDLRDASGATVSRAARPVALGAVAPRGWVSVPVAVPLPARAGDYRLSLGLVDAAGRPLATRGVATTTFPIRAHLPIAATTEVSLPRVLHRREASLLEVRYWSGQDHTATDAAPAEDRSLSLGWRALDPTNGRIVAQGNVELGVIGAGRRGGAFFAPFVAPALRGTYLLEYELRERGQRAGRSERLSIEIAGPRTYPDDLVAAFTRVAPVRAGAGSRAMQLR